MAKKRQEIAEELWVTVSDGRRVSNTGLIDEYGIIRPLDGGEKVLVETADGLKRVLGGKLIWRLFINPTGATQPVKHKDGDQGNCHVDNLTLSADKPRVDIQLLGESAGTVLVSKQALECLINVNREILAENTRLRSVINLSPREDADSLTEKYKDGFR